MGAVSGEIRYLSSWVTWNLA